MNLENLTPYIFDKITIYKESQNHHNDFAFEDLYKGNVDDVPEELLKREVCSIGAKRKNMIEVLVL